MESRLAPLAFSVLLLQCGGVQPIVPMDGSTPSIELGTGETMYQPLSMTGGTIELVFGPQGGWHVDLTVRMVSLDPEGVVLDYSVIEPQSGRVLNHSSRSMLTRRRVILDGDTAIRVGDRAVFDIRQDTEVLNVELDFSVTATLPSGVQLRDVRRLRVVDERR